MVPEAVTTSDSDDDFYDGILLSDVQLKLLFGDNADGEFQGFTPDDIREWFNQWTFKCKCDMKLFQINVELFVSYDKAY